MVLSNADLQTLVSLYSKSQFTEALTEARRMLARHADDPSLNNMAGVLLARLGQNDEALRYYEKALSLKPRYAEAFNN